MARVLLVEDDRTLADSMAYALEHAGHEVVKAYNGAQALALLADAAQPAPEVLVLDVMMPMASGVDVCAAISKDDRVKALPVVVISGKGETRGAFGRFANVTAYLEKPFDGQKLRECVARALARR